jgi:hypothetical protein
MCGVSSQGNTALSEGIRATLMHAVRGHALELVFAGNWFGTGEESFEFRGQTFHIFLIRQTVNLTVRNTPQPSRIELTKQSPMVRINDELRRPESILAEGIVDISGNFY